MMNGVTQPATACLGHLWRRAVIEGGGRERRNRQAVPRWQVPHIPSHRPLLGKSLTREARHLSKLRIALQQGINSRSRPVAARTPGAPAILDARAIHVHAIRVDASLPHK